MNNTFADLHIHTCFSDGILTPQEIINKANKLGFSCLAITDHDCIDGISPAISCSLKYYIQIIPAVELTAEYDNTEIHILGYFIDYKNKQFCNKLEILCDARRDRIYKMVAKLNALDVNIKAEEVLKLSGKGSVGRLHVAHVLLRNGYVKTIPEAFNKYIGNNGPCYVNRFKLTPQEAIKIIKKINGIAVVAHPHSMNKDELIIKLIKYGIGGIEVYHPDHTRAVTLSYLEMAKKYNLLVTGGSDYHGFGKKKAQFGGIKVSYELVERLKQSYVGNKTA